MRFARQFVIALALSILALAQSSAPTAQGSAPAPPQTPAPASGQSSSPAPNSPSAQAPAPGSEQKSEQPSGQTANDSSKPSATDSAKPAAPDVSSKPASGVDSAKPASATPGKRRKTPPNFSPTAIPRKVVREGGASEPGAQIIPGTTPAEAERERRNAEQWLNSAGDQLKQLSGRQLQPPQQETVAQIRNYMDGARSALQEGDVRRASILAEKAHLLADDLAKH